MVLDLRSWLVEDLDVTVWAALLRLASRSMDCSGLALIPVVVLWAAVALLVAILVIGEIFDCWHRGRCRGAHHLTGPAARTVKEIAERLRREATMLSSPRVIVVRRRMTDASTTVTAPSPAGLPAAPIAAARPQGLTDA